jgi:tetratricopeptide (TPR) repeat protein
MSKRLRGLGMVATIALCMTATAQSKYGATPQDSVTCIQSLSLYQEFVKNKSYMDAYGPWRAAITTCPASSKGLYQNGANMLKDFIRQEKDIKDASSLKVGMSEAEVVGQIGAAKKKNRTTDKAGVSEQWVYDGLYVYFAEGKVKSFQERPEDGSGNRRRQLIDSLYLIYDMRITHFGEEAYVLGRKGVDMMSYSPDRCEEALSILQRSVELGGARTEGGTLSAFYQALNCQYAAGKVDKARMMAEYVKEMEIIEGNLADPDMKEVDKEYYTMARDNVNTLFFKIAECADIGRIAQEMVTANPDDLEMKKRLLRVLNGKDCTEEKVYLPLARDVHDADPSSESAYSLAMSLVKGDDLSGAAKYLKQAADLCDGCQDKPRYLLKAGQVASANGNHALARSYANQILSIEPKNGEAIMLIGNAVAAQGAACEVPESWGVYWLAYDYYQRAKSLDPSVAEKAGERMAASAARFPTQAEAFFHQLTDGQAYQVACAGLNESTTVRTRK